MITHSGVHVFKFGDRLIWRIAGLIVAVTLVIIASGLIGGIAGRWVK